MRSVNQSIGRAIRHQEDYATIILLDSRYNKDKIIKRLPAWIRASVKVAPKFGDALKNVSGFFKTKA